MIIVWIFNLFMVLSHGSQAMDFSGPYIEIDLPQGKIQGTKQIIGESRVYYSFRGIPYAEAPVGNLRFKDPVPAKPWYGLRKDMKVPSCPQAVVELSLRDTEQFIGEEDCLYLNVYTPKPCRSNLPVMVYIHGGGFKFGDSEFMGGTPHRLLVKDIVLVSFHYRLGTLGFLSTGDSVLPGNYGLKDQTLALQWVQDNIQYLGGDPDRVTIFGESAGAASVHYQMLSPYGKGLFKRGIMQSGTAINSWSLRDDHKETAYKIGIALGCSNDPHPTLSSSQLLSCFQKASVEDLVKTPISFSDDGFLFLMQPRVDGDFLPAHPAQLMREGRYQKVDLISGTTQNEGAGIVKEIMSSNQTTNATFMESLLTHTLPFATGIGNVEDAHYLNQRALYHYMNGILVQEEDVDQFEKLFTESSMVMVQDETSALHARDTFYGRRVYRYELQHRGMRSFGDYVKVPFGEKWVNHVDDLQYLFNGVLGFPPLENPQDIYISDIIISLWTNFAKTGNPTPDLALGFKWEAMTSPSDFRFLALKLSPNMKEDYRGENREFWRNMPTENSKMLFPNLHQSSRNSINVGV